MLMTPRLCFLSPQGMSDVPCWLGCFTPPFGSTFPNDKMAKNANPLSDVEVKMYLLRMYSAEVAKLL